MLMGKELKHQALFQLNVTNVDDDENEEMEGETTDLLHPSKSQKQPQNPVVSSSYPSTSRKGHLDCYIPKPGDDAGKMVKRICKI